jgi:hypothetical protein
MHHVHILFFSLDHKLYPYVVLPPILYQKSLMTATRSAKYKTFLSVKMFIGKLYIRIFLYESNFQDKYMYMIFTFSNSTI